MLASAPSTADEQHHPLILPSVMLMECPLGPALGWASPLGGIPSCSGSSLTRHPRPLCSGVVGQLRLRLQLVLSGFALFPPVHPVWSSHHEASFSLCHLSKFKRSFSGFNSPACAVRSHLDWMPTKLIHSCCCGSVAQSCLTLFDLMDCRMPGSAVSSTISWSLLKSTFIELVMPSHPLSSPPAFSLPQHQGLFQCLGSSHQVTKVLELQLQQSSF